MLLEKLGSTNCQTANQWLLLLCIFPEPHDSSQRGSLALTTRLTCGTIATRTASTTLKHKYLNNYYMCTAQSTELQHSLRNFVNFPYPLRKFRKRCIPPKKFLNSLYALRKFRQQVHTPHSKFQNFLHFIRNSGQQASTPQKMTILQPLKKFHLPTPPLQKPEPSTKISSTGRVYLK